MNLRKILLLLFAGAILFSFSFSLYFQFSKNKKNETKKDDLSFVDYITKNAVPVISFERILTGDGENTERVKIGRIPIILEDGKKYTGKFLAHDIWPGAYLVIYKHSNSLSKGKKVKVSGKYEDDDNFWIYSAEL